MLNWAEKQGFGPLCCHGISMGGHMASLAATAWAKPICLVPCLAWTSGSSTFCQVENYIYKRREEICPIKMLNTKKTSHTS